jgi:hypothetical protein
MSSTETTDVGMFFFANKGSELIPGFPGRMMTTHCDYLAQAPQAPAPEQVQCRSVKDGKVYACYRCGAHRPLGYKCCGFYCGTQGESPVERRNIHLHPEADEDEVDDFLAAHLARLNCQRNE